MNLKVRKQSPRLVKPHYQNDPIPPPTYIPLSAFDTVSYRTDVAAVYAFKAPTVPNHVIENGLRRVLAVYREWAGKLTTDDLGRPSIFLNDQGVPLVEATSECVLNQAVPLNPSVALLDLHPSTEHPEALRQVQLTRFACGGLTIGVTSNHLIADGYSASLFTVAWGRAARGLPLNHRTLHDRSIFFPRSPPRCKFEHYGVEYISRKREQAETHTPAHIHRSSPCCRSDEKIKIYKAHFTPEFLATLKARASVCCPNKPYTTFESLLAHLWKRVTLARGLDGSVITQLRISVNGRVRLSSRVPSDYFGNLVLWAFPRTKVKELLQEPLDFAAKLIRDAVATVSEEYFCSFIDFVEMNGKDGLLPTAEMENMVLCPNLEVDSWLRFPFYDVDFGGGSPCDFAPTWLPYEGFLSMIPSATGDGSVEVLVPLHQHNMPLFMDTCYSLDHILPETRFSSKI